MIGTFQYGWEATMHLRIQECVIAVSLPRLFLGEGCSSWGFFCVSLQPRILVFFCPPSSVTYLSASPSGSWTACQRSFHRILSILYHTGLDISYLALSTDYKHKQHRVRLQR